MSKYIILTICVTLLFSCKPKVTTPADTVAEETEKINFETVIDDETLLLGRINRQGLQMPEYKHWFDSTYQAYIVQTDKLPEIKEGLVDVNFKVFLGTWCEDSQREVPALLKILDKSNYDQNKIDMVAVDRDKVLPEDEVKGYEIELVPTIILYRNEAEIGRIIEMPNTTLEEDLVGMVGDEGERGS